MRPYIFQWVLMDPYPPYGSISILKNPFASLWILMVSYWSLLVLNRP